MGHCGNVTGTTRVEVENPPSQLNLSLIDCQNWKGILEIIKITPLRLQMNKLRPRKENRFGWWCIAGRTGFCAQHAGFLVEVLAVTRSLSWQHVVNVRLTALCGGRGYEMHWKGGAGCQ